MIVLILYMDLLNFSWIKMCIFEEYGALKYLCLDCTSCIICDQLSFLLMLSFKGVGRGGVGWGGETYIIQNSEKDCRL